MIKVLIETCLLLGVFCIVIGVNYGSIIGNVIAFIGGIFLTIYTYHTHQKLDTGNHKDI
jgi:drug/metabolite transporter (DMT)-like permease